MRCAAHVLTLGNVVNVLCCSRSDVRECCERVVLLTF